jgi:hypothetical protein
MNTAKCSSSSGGKRPRAIGASLQLQKAVPECRVGVAPRNLADASNGPSLYREPRTWS